MLTNEKMRQITHKHTKRHGMTLKEYCEKFGKEMRELTCEDVLKNRPMSYRHMIEKYGDVEGRRRWEQYRERQAHSNSLEYKKEKHGWDEKKFKDYNLSRAVTLENMVKRHGEEKGAELYNNYVDVQKYVGIKLEYFVEKYGEDLGMEKYYDMLRSKLRIFTGFSKVSQEFFDKIDMNGKPTFYHDKNNEYVVHVKKYKPYSIDFYCSDVKKGIEFYGDYWHANPSKYKPDFLLRSGYTASEKWQMDQRKINDLKDRHGIEIMVIWEGDYYNNPDECVEKARKFLYE